jgi:hypothetical protein
MPPCSPASITVHLTLYAANGTIVGTLLLKASRYHTDACALEWCQDQWVTGYVPLTQLRAALDAVEAAMQAGAGTLS